MKHHFARIKENVSLVHLFMMKLREMNLKLLEDKKEAKGANDQE